MYARISALLLAFVVAVSGLASAQERFGMLQGKVTDQQGMAIPGVTVAARNLQSGEVRTFVTDGNGQFLAADLNPGRYNISFELSGFSKVERNDVSVVLGRTFQLDAQMRSAPLPKRCRSPARRHRWSTTAAPSSPTT